MATRVKVSGLTRPGDVELAIALGAWALGFAVAGEAQRPGAPVPAAAAVGPGAPEPSAGGRARRRCTRPRRRCAQRGPRVERRPLRDRACRGGDRRERRRGGRRGRRGGGARRDEGRRPCGRGPHRGARRARGGRGRLRRLSQQTAGRAGRVSGRLGPRHETGVQARHSGGRCRPAKRGRGRAQGASLRDRRGATPCTPARACSTQPSCASS